MSASAPPANWLTSVRGVATLPAPSDTAVGTVLYAQDEQKYYAGVRTPAGAPAFVPLSSLGLGDLTDVAAEPPPSNGQTLIWQDGEWVAATPIPPSLGLDDLVDVAVGTAADGQVLELVGATWRARDLPAPPAPVLLAHSHDFQLFRYANHTHDTTPTLVDNDSGQLIASFDLTLQTGLRYSVLAVATYEAYAESGSSVEVRLGVKVGTQPTSWGSSTSSENESSVVNASDLWADVVPTGTGVTIGVWARREVSTIAQCWVRAGHAYAVGFPANSLGVE